MVPASIVVVAILSIVAASVPMAVVVPVTPTSLVPLGVPERVVVRFILVVGVLGVSLVVHAGADRVEEVVVHVLGRLLLCLLALLLLLQQVVLLDHLVEVERLGGLTLRSIVARVATLLVVVIAVVPAFVVVSVVSVARSSIIVVSSIVSIVLLGLVSVPALLVVSATLAVIVVSFVDLR
jgi:hypothetical protein